MKTEIVLSIYCVLLSVTKVTLKAQYTSTVKNETLSTSKFNSDDDPYSYCVKRIQELNTNPLNSSDCCITNICLNFHIFRAVTQKRPQIKELVRELCTDNFYLSKEQTNGCRFKNRPARYENNNTNFTSKTPNKEYSAIANCSLKFKMATINGDLKHNGCEFNWDSNMQSIGRILLPSPLISESKESLNSGSTNSSLQGKKIKLENMVKPSPRSDSLQFLDVPKGDDMRIHELHLNDEYLLFEAFSTLMGYLQPVGFPTDLVRDLLNDKISLLMFIYQMLKLEIVEVGWILFWAILSLCLPFAIGTQLCCRSNIQRLNEDFSNGSTNFYDKWTGNILPVLLHILLLLLLCPIIIILAGNEQISRSLSNSEYTSEIIYEDINTFIRNTHMQITLVTTSSTDIAFEAIRKDLEELDVLLGKPFQEALSSQVGIELAVEELDQLKTSTAKVTNLVSDILNECTLAGKERSSLEEQLREISRQLTIVRQQCTLRDRALCYTLQYSGYDVTFSGDNITQDMKIQHLHHLGTEDNFNFSIDMARERFANIHFKVTGDMDLKVKELKFLLTQRRGEVYKSAHALDELTRSVSESVQQGRETVSTVIQKLMTWDLWRWLGILGVAIVLTVIWGLLLCGAPCGCGITSKTIPLLTSGVILSCTICLIVWSLGTVTFLLGGHGESMMCRSLYEHPYYKTLSDLLDSGGVFNPYGGILNEFKGNDTIKLRDILRSCQNDEVSFTTFHLYNTLDINKILNHKSWDDFDSLISNFSINANNLEILNPDLQLNLQVLSTVSNVNLTFYRAELSKAITKRDLSSFADQLNSVARQLSDPMSTRKIDNLAFMVRKVVRGEMQKLVDTRNRILFKITALEVLLLPLNKQANQSLLNLKAVQHYLDTKAYQVAEKTTRKFTARIESYLDDLYGFVSEKLTKHIGKCRPLWTVFHSSRIYMCRLIIDPLNGISFACFFLILLFSTIAPVVSQLVEFYRGDNNEDVLTPISHRRSRDGILINDEGTWASPSSVTPEIPLVSTSAGNQGQHTTWVSPRPPSNISSQIQSPRIPTIPMMSRNYSPQRTARRWL